MIAGLVGATFSQFVLNQVCNVFRWPYSCIVAVGISLCVDVIVKSPAYDIMTMFCVHGSPPPLRLSVIVVDWCVSRLLWMICCRTI